MQLFRVLWLDDFYVYIEILDTGEKKKIHIEDYDKFQLNYMEV